MSDALLGQISSGAEFKIKGRAASTVVGRAEIENQSINTPKPIYGAGRTDMLVSKSFLFVAIHIR